MIIVLAPHWGLTVSGVSDAARVNGEGAMIVGGAR